MANDFVFFTGKMDHTQNSSDAGVWVTNGTSAGTWELAQGDSVTGFTAVSSKVLFSDTNAQLFVTDGTAAGTMQLSVPGLGFRGSVLELTSLGDKALVAGWTDASGSFGLWVTDGTTAGTSELSVAGAYAGGLFNNDSYTGNYSPVFTVLGGEALFEGWNASGKLDLWRTDGTSAGTSELNVAGFDSMAVVYSKASFTLLGNEALFSGKDTNGNYGLWATDGTGAGTSEILVSGTQQVNSPHGLTVLGNKALFAAGDASGSMGLWVSDGTAAGTSELLVAGAYSGGVFAQDPPTFVALGGKALFSGRDSSGQYGLWVTDGTAAGTAEVSVAGASSTGLNPSDFAVLGDKVLFKGADANGNYNLWVTDGTAAGTSELVAGGYPGGLFSNLTQSFTVFGNEVLFEGLDSNGNVKFWVTDGTAAGTSELSVPGSAASNVSVPLATYAFHLPPTVLQSVTASPASGVEGAGQTIAITLTMNNAVAVTGVPTLTLNDGGTAYYDAAASAALGDPTKMVFEYTVGASADEHNVGQLTVMDGSLAGASIHDLGGNTPDFSNLVTAFPNLQIVVAPAAKLLSVAASPGSGVETAGQTIAITLGMSKAVTVTGTPTLTLNDGGTAYYDAAATAALGDPSKMVFAYTVGASAFEHNVGQLTVTGGSLAGATVLDGAGNAPDFSGLVTAFANLQIEVAPPATVTSIVTSPVSGVLGFGQTITLTLNMSKAVTVAGGTPTLTLNDGGKATYDAAATATLGDPTKLVFDYTVHPGDQGVPSLAIVNGSFNGATIVDPAGNTPDFQGVLTSFPAIAVEARPVVASVLATPGSGEVTTGSLVAIDLRISEAVTVSGTPVLLLNDGATATYDAAHSTATDLKFDYAVGSEVTSDLRISGIVNGFVADSVGANVDFSGAGADLGLQVNTTSSGAAGPSVGNFTVSNSRLELFGPTAAAVTFGDGSGSGDFLKLDDPRDFSGTVAGFAPSETFWPNGTTIDLADIAYGAATSLGYAPNSDNTGGMLTISDGANTAHLQMLGSYSASSFIAANDGTGHTQISNWIASGL